MHCHIAGIHLLSKELRCSLGRHSASDPLLVSFTFLNSEFCMLLHVTISQYLCMLKSNLLWRICWLAGASQKSQGDMRGCQYPTPPKNNLQLITNVLFSLGGTSMENQHAFPLIYYDIFTDIFIFTYIYIRWYWHNINLHATLPC